ncbi:MAG: peptide chain release factor N(5)-glutamine methyltransferase [Bacteroidales bacterium]|nr:peptide chain release factor N(5)-glutamine methyltransferase [Bacteroidales bacterium]
MLLADFIRKGTARLEREYPSPEARGMVLMLCEEKLGVKDYTHIIEPQTKVPPRMEEELERDLQRLCEGEPIQYVLGVTEFCDRRFAVGPGVLIPRPETELLVAEGVKTLRGMDLQEPPRVLDLCTGSGCIAWSVQLEIRDARVIGVDLSEEALSYARGQFPGVKTAPLFLKADVLDTEQDFPEGPYDLILANPPYIMEKERTAMRRNVLGYEPDLALFVPDGDPLRFYRATARWAQRFLAPGGTGLVEINETLGAETAGVFREAGFNNVQILRDFFEKDRIIRFSE